MHTKGAAAAASDAVVDKRHLDSLGVLLPVRLHALSFLPGRHPLGRAGEGMRFLRSRPYEPGQDNPRDIDKFSPQGEYWINEWESEAQAAIRVLVDMSGSTSVTSTAAVRNLALLQITYSLWRASDRVRAVLYGADNTEEIAERNLKSQLGKLVDYLSPNPAWPGQDALDVLSTFAVGRNAAKDDLVFLISDFNSCGDPGHQEDPRRWRSMLRSYSCDIVPVIISFELSSRQRGFIKLWDGERNSQYATLITPARALHINSKEAKRVARLERMFRSLGLDSLTLRQEHDVYPALAGLARLRRRRRA